MPRRLLWASCGDRGLAYLAQAQSTNGRSLKKTGIFVIMTKTSTKMPDSKELMAFQQACEGGLRPLQNENLIGLDSRLGCP